VYWPLQGPGLELVRDLTLLRLLEVPGYPEGNVSHMDTMHCMQKRHHCCHHVLYTAAVKEQQNRLSVMHKWLEVSQNNVKAIRSKFDLVGIGNPCMPKVKLARHLDR
jgi:hypothetical protein